MNKVGYIEEEYQMKSPPFNQCNNNNVDCLISLDHMPPNTGSTGSCCIVPVVPEYNNNNNNHHHHHHHLESKCSTIITESITTIPTLTQKNESIILNHPPDDVSQPQQSLAPQLLKHINHTTVNNNAIVQHQQQQQQQRDRSMWVIEPPTITTTTTNNNNNNNNNSAAVMNVLQAIQYLDEYLSLSSTRQILDEILLDVVPSTTTTSTTTSTSTSTTTTTAISSTMKKQTYKKKKKHQTKYNISTNDITENQHRHHSDDTESPSIVMKQQQPQSQPSQPSRPIIFDNIDAIQSLRFIQAGRYEIFVQSRGKKPSYVFDWLCDHIWSIYYNNTTTTTTTTNNNNNEISEESSSSSLSYVSSTAMKDAILDYAIQQASRDTRISATNTTTTTTTTTTTFGNYSMNNNNINNNNNNNIYYDNFSLIVSYDPVTAQPQHIDLLYPNFQYGLIITDQSPGTTVYQSPYSITSVKDISVYVWKNMPSTIYTAMEQDPIVTSLVSQFGDVLCPNIERISYRKTNIDTNNRLESCNGDSTINTCSSTTSTTTTTTTTANNNYYDDEVLLPRGTLLSLPGSEIHAGPSSLKYRAVLFFSACPDMTNTIPYHPDTQYFAPLLCCDFISLLWNKLGKEDRIFILHRLLDSINETQCQHLERHIRDSNLIGFIRKVTNWETMKVRCGLTKKYGQNFTIDDYIIEFAGKGKRVDVQEIGIAVVAHNNQPRSVNFQKINNSMENDDMQKAFDKISCTDLVVEYEGEYHPAHVFAHRPETSIPNTESSDDPAAAAAAVVEVTLRPNVINVMLYYPLDLACEGLEHPYTLEWKQDNSILCTTVIVNGDEEVKRTLFDGMNGTLRDSDGIIVPCYPSCLASVSLQDDTSTKKPKRKRSKSITPNSIRPHERVQVHKGNEAAPTISVRSSRTSKISKCMNTDNSVNDETISNASMNNITTGSISDNDVLCGSHGSKKHIGNMKFYALVESHKCNYMNATAGNRINICFEIIGIIRDTSGRFLRKNASSGLWFDIEDADVCKVIRKRIFYDKSILPVLKKDNSRTDNDSISGNDVLSCLTSSSLQDDNSTKKPKRKKSKSIFPNSIRPRKRVQDHQQTSFSLQDDNSTKKPKCKKRKSIIPNSIRPRKRVQDQQGIEAAPTISVGSSRKSTMSQRLNTDNSVSDETIPNALMNNITSVNDNDIVCGMHRRMKNAGNEFFLKLVKLQVYNYYKADLENKKKIVSEILCTIRGTGGRFLRKNKTSGLWNVEKDTDALNVILNKLRKHTLVWEKENSRRDNDSNMMNFNRLEIIQNTPSLVDGNDNDDYFTRSKSTMSTFHSTNSSGNNETNSNSQINNITNISGNDVLCDPSPHVFNYIGNAKFRALVKSQLHPYVKANENNRKKVIIKILTIIRGNGGRFLRKNETSGLWYDTEDADALQVIHQRMYNFKKMPALSEEDSDSVANEMNFDGIDNNQTTSSVDDTNDGFDEAVLLGASDVLCGVQGFDTYPGNRTFLGLLESFDSTSTKRSSIDLLKCCDSIICSIHKAKGRFLRRNQVTGLWYEHENTDAQKVCYDALLANQQRVQDRKLPPQKVNDSLAHPTTMACINSITQEEDSYHTSDVNQEEYLSTVAVHSGDDGRTSVSPAVVTLPTLIPELHSSLVKPLH